MRKVLIANRGEIAVRIAGACADASLDSVAVYADADADAPHAAAATEAYSLPGSSPAETYLNVAQLLEIADRSGADAVHPGYGFLSENAEFAQTVLDAGLTWIGPRPDTMRLLGNKITARRIARAAGAPLVPGSDGAIESAAEVRAFAEEHGLPILVKAAFGGGGRGIRIVRELDEADEAFDSAVRESVAAFGRRECFVERFVERPRHVEAQVLADTHGNVIVAGTRDCSLQRRNQKLVEEAPAPFLTASQRGQIHASAKAICREAGYHGAATVEYLLAADGTLSFLEVNARLQVEHPVTEETSGIDLVLAQLSIAAGEPLATTEDPVPRGHAFEFRINAEDVGRGFLPCPGTITGFAVPTGPGIRIDTGVRAGSVVPAQFDSLLAKLIVTGANRAQALSRARRALAAFDVAGPATVLPFHRAVVRDPAFCSATAFSVHTSWIETEFAEKIPAGPRFSPAATESARQTISIEIDGRRVALGLPARLVAGLGAGSGTLRQQSTERHSTERDTSGLLPPMSGSVVKWLAEPGTSLTAGDPVLVLEAMKMETIVSAHRDGILGRHQVGAGDAVTGDTVLATIE